MNAIRTAIVIVLSILVAACPLDGDRDNQDFARGSNAGANCSGQCADASTFLTISDVRQVLAQAVAQARALDTSATIAVVDRVGNVLAVFRMTDVVSDSGGNVTLTSGLPVDGGLEGLQLPVSGAAGGDGLAAIAKAITGAYLSSEGNGFSTRTASQIVQRHFNPGERNQPGGPLFGVQFSQLPCSDFMLRLPDSSTAGPKRSPLGLSADPGGFPLYKSGTPVGGVGVISRDFVYGLDRNMSDFDSDADELIALAATFRFAVPADRQANRITVEGKTIRFSDVDFDAVAEQARNPPAISTMDGSLLPITDYYAPASTDPNAANAIRAGEAFGQTVSGIAPDPSVGNRFPGRDAFVFVDGSGTERFPPTAGTALSTGEVQTILDQALAIANRARAQIRRPLGSSARVTISVVDADGTILGMARTRDAPVFGADVSLQKARTAALFSSLDAETFIRNLPNAQYLNPDLTPDRQIDFDDYVDAAQALIGAGALNDGTAFSDRSGGNLSRPNFPDGIDDNGPGPFSKPPGEWSPFSTGLQLDSDFNALISHLLYVLGINGTDIDRNCVGAGPDFNPVNMTAPRLANGSQIFPGSVPIYRGNQLIGGIGVSGDGIDQDDMIAFLGLHSAGQILGTVNNAPPGIRADNLTPGGHRLRYVNCPQSPFNDSDEQHACSGK